MPAGHLDGQIVTSLRAQPRAGRLNQQPARLGSYQIAAFSHAHHAGLTRGCTVGRTSPDGRLGRALVVPNTVALLVGTAVIIVAS